MAENTLAHEAVGVFHETQTFQSAIDDLLSSGFDRADLSFVASRRAVEEKLGHAYRSVRELEDEPAVPTVAYVSTESLGEAEGAVAAALIYIGAVATAERSLHPGAPSRLPWPPSLLLAPAGHRSARCSTG